MEDAGLKVVFSEVLKGFTLVESKNYGKIQVKHFTNFDSAELDIKNKLFYDKAISQGLPSRNDRIEYLLKENIWTEEKNKEILQVKSMLSGLRNSKSKVFLQAHIDNINTQIGPIYVSYKYDEQIEKLLISQLTSFQMIHVSLGQK